jgi:hypothetical protein
MKVAPTTQAQAADMQPAGPSSFRPEGEQWLCNVDAGNAQPFSGRVTGDPARIVLFIAMARSQATHQTWSRQLDASGVFSFNGLPPGDYRIWGDTRADAFFGFQPRSIDVHCDGATAPLAFEIR